MSIVQGYQVCSRCVMDTTDPDIVFDDRGVCNHCNEYERRVAHELFSDVDRERRLAILVDMIKQNGKGKAYDCVIGVSGGVDSTFLAYSVAQLGLRPLAVHLDNGWNSELAVQNIENVLKKMSIELFTHVLDWREFRDLQLAFLKASTPDSEIPTDHAIFALLYQSAERLGLRYVLPGFNLRTESHLPRAWSQGHYDWLYIKSVHRQFGTVPLKTFPHFTLTQRFKYSITQSWVPMLNLLGYEKKKALATLKDKVGWRDYGGKHYESIYTRFYQGYILPRKFGFDKRKMHFSSLICSGEMTRENALLELKKESYPLNLQQEDREYVCKKLEITDSEFESIMALPLKSYHDYPSYDRVLNGRLGRVLRLIYHSVKRTSRI